MTKYGRPSSRVPMSCTCTSRRSWIRRMSRASTRKRLRTSWLLAQLSAITLTATGTSRSSSWPSHTVANDPAPKRRTSRYRPMESIATILADVHVPANSREPAVRPLDATYVHLDFWRFCTIAQPKQTVRNLREHRFLTVRGGCSRQGWSAWQGPPAWRERHWYAWN
jgi:hypothetical protein